MAGLTGAGVDAADGRAELVLDGMEVVVAGALGGVLYDDVWEGVLETGPPTDGEAGDGLTPGSSKFSRILASLPPPPGGPGLWFRPGGRETRLLDPMAPFAEPALLFC